MIKRADSSYLVVDHTKFIGNANILFDGLQEIDTIITDQQLSAEWESFAEKSGIKIEYCAD